MMMSGWIGLEFKGGHEGCESVITPQYVGAV